MEAVFQTVLQMSIRACLVILAVLAVRLPLKKAPRKYAYLLWTVVGFRLICPVSVESVVSIFNVVNRAVPAPKMYVTAGPDPMMPVTGPALTQPVAPDPITAAPARAPVPVDWFGIAAVVWCVGVVLLLGYAIVSVWRLRRRLSTAVRLEGNVYQSELVASPFILGIFCPRIYVPYGLEGQVLSYVLAHERAHLRYGDHLVKLLAFAVLAVHWFNPLVWLAFFLMSRDMEMRCDEAVLAQNGYSTKAYSETLLSFAVKSHFPAPVPLAFGETAVKGRIKNALRWKQPKLWVTVLAVLLCAAALVACGTSAKETKNTTALSLWNTTVTLDLPEGLEEQASETSRGQPLAYVFLPTVYDLPGDLADCSGAVWTNSGGMEQFGNLLDWENGVIQTAPTLWNHTQILDEYGPIDGTALPSYLYRAEHDLFTAAEQAQLLGAGYAEDELPGPAAFWHIVMAQPEEETILVFSLSCEGFTQDDAISLAKSVKVSPRESGTGAKETEGPLSIAEAVQVLFDSAEWDGDTFRFTIPKNYETPEDWTIQLKDDFGTGVHPVNQEQRTVWEAGKTYEVDGSDIQCLEIVVWLPGPNGEQVRYESLKGRDLPFSSTGYGVKHELDLAALEVYGVSLGDSREQVIAAMGQPTEETTDEIGNNVLSYSWNGSAVTYYLWNGAVDNIQAESSDCDWLGEPMTTNDIFARFGDPDGASYSQKTASISYTRRSDARLGIGESMYFGFTINDSAYTLDGNFSLHRIVNNFYRPTALVYSENIYTKDWWVSIDPEDYGITPEELASNPLPDFETMSLEALGAYFLNTDGAGAEGSSNQLYLRFQADPIAVLEYLSSLGWTQDRSEHPAVTTLAHYLMIEGYWDRDNFLQQLEACKSQSLTSRQQDLLDYLKTEFAQYTRWAELQH